MSISSNVLLALSVVTVASLSPPEAILKFTPTFYRHSAETYGGDVVVSPFSAFNALAMLSGATKGNTYTQLVDGLGIERNKAKVAKQIRNYHNDMKDDAGSADLTIFNRIFIQNDYKLNLAFKKLATKQFRAGIKKLDFHYPYDSSTKINALVERKTNQTIQDVVRPNGEMIGGDTRAVLVSGAYFHGNWERPFDTENSYWGSFNGVPVGFMTQVDTFNYAVLPELGATAVELDYADSDLSLVIVLPDYNLSVLQYRLRSYNWLDITANMQQRYVNLHLPKFHSYFQFSLNPVMTNMNMGDMLTNNADLSGLLNSCEDLKVFEVHHSTSVRIDEGESEIASGTSILPYTYILADIPTCEPVVDFNANRPFFYYIRNKADDSIIFVGHLLSPITG